MIKYNIICNVYSLLEFYADNIGKTTEIEVHIIKSNIKTNNIW